MEFADSFQQSRRVTEDFTSRTLAAIPSDLGKLAYVCSLKDPSSGRYLHEGLAFVYSDTSIQKALAGCHEELFSRILETPLEEQEVDWRMCFGLAGDPEWALEDGRGVDHPFRRMVPEGFPDYLADLFCSNYKALRAVISAKRAIVEPGA